MTIVIAKYNEDISWINSLDKSHKVVIIDKLNNEPNIGRESHTYLKYIADNYESLSGQYIFCQGNPFAHCREFISKINIGSPLDFFEFGDRLLCNDIYGRPNHSNPLPGDKIWNSIFPSEPIPDRLCFYCGAQFLVSADVIKSRPLSFYKHCLDIHYLIPEAPWIFERIWNKIFSSKIKDSKKYYTVGMAVGDSLIAISNILSLNLTSEFGVICIPNPNCFSLQDFNRLIRNIPSDNLVYLNSNSYYYLINYFLAYAKMAPGAWESLVRELSYFSGIPASSIWPTFPRIDYPLSKNHISITSDIEIPFSRYILFNPLSYNSSKEHEHNHIWKDILIEVTKLDIPVIVVSQHYINLDSINCYNLTGKTKSVIDDLYLASKSLFTITTGNNLAVFCNFNDIPHIVIAQKNICRYGHAEFFRKWMTQDKLRIVEFGDNMRFFKACLSDLISDL